MTGQRPAPTIGVTVSSRAVGPEADARAARNAAELRDALAQHGARVLLLAPGEEIPAHDLDGLLLGGGGDLDPALGCYVLGWAREALGEVDRARDDFELGLCRTALDHGLPLLGVCRGAQVLGTALGCRLVGDIERQLARARAHRHAGEEVWHPVQLDLGSRLCDVLGEARVQVNSSHHQALDTLGDGVSRVAWAEDSVTEAIESGDGFVIGVQWHPERMAGATSSQRLFEAFVAAAGAQRLTKGNDP